MNRHRDKVLRNGWPVFFGMDTKYSLWRRHAVWFTRLTTTKTNQQTIPTSMIVTYNNLERLHHTQPTITQSHQFWELGIWGSNNLTTVNSFHLMVHCTSWCSDLGMAYALPIYRCCEGPIEYLVKNHHITQVNVTCRTLAWRRHALFALWALRFLLRWPLSLLKQLSLTSAATRFNGRR